MNELIKAFIDLVPEKYRPTALAFIALSPVLGRAYHSMTNGGGLKGIFGAIWLGTNTPAAQDAAPKNASIKVPLMLATASLVLLLSGCGTAQTAAYKAATATQVSVETAMTAWQNYVAAGHATMDQRAKVKSLYVRYQSCATTLVDAEEALASLTATNAPAGALPSATSNQTAAQAALAQALSDLVATLQSFGVKI